MQNEWCVYLDWEISAVRTHWSAEEFWIAVIPQECFISMPAFLHAAVRVISSKGRVYPYDATMTDAR